MYGVALAGSPAVTRENLVPDFVSRLNEFRSSICAQLREPMLFQGQPVTCSLLAELGPLVAKAMNTQGVLAPASIKARTTCW